MDKKAIEMADKIYREGSMNKLYEYIKPYLDIGDPYAHYYYSKFSLAEWNESDDDINKRYVDSLVKAAEGNVAGAMYRLSSLYFIGDMVELNVEAGKRYLDRAIGLNFGPAKLSVGINLYYGSNGYPNDIGRAFEMISEAVEDNVEDASEVLQRLKQ